MKVRSGCNNEMLLGSRGNALGWVEGQQVLIGLRVKRLSQLRVATLAQYVSFRHIVLGIT